MTRKLCALLLLLILVSLSSLALAAHTVSLTCTDSDTSVVSYNFLRSNISGGPYSQINPSPLLSCVFTDSLVTPGSTYYYVARAKNAAGDESVNSAEGKAVLPQPPQAPAITVKVN
jgi:hypothetical protein